VISGTWVSLTITVNEQVDVFIDASVTEQFTVVVPLGNVDPVGGAHATDPNPGQLSVAVASG